MRGNIGKAFLVGLLAGVVALVIGGALGLVIHIIPWPVPFLGQFLANLANALLLPITTAPLTLLYYDLRIRKEAFDLEMLSTALAQPAIIL